MAESSKIVNTGLRGVTVATTRISHVDGQAGKLIYRGFLINDLAENTTFEEIVHLLLFEKLPAKDELQVLDRRMKAERELPPDLIDALKTQPRESLPMVILQASAAMLANHDPNAAELEQQNVLDIGLRLIARFPSVVAAWHRIRNNLEPVAPDSNLSHAANFLYMLTGETPDEEVARWFDTCLVLHAEHSFNASTFAAREVASTRANIYAAISAAVGSLSGELHGGANERVMQMLLNIGSLDQIDNYIDRTLEKGGKIMGLGHAIYKTGDPRGKILAKISRKLGERNHDTKWYDMTIELEKKATRAFKEKKGLEIYSNVDFYSAAVYYMMGIPIDLFTPVFAISRVSGWTAHVLEEQFGGASGKPVLYRPSSDYVGEYCGPEECAFVPMEKRQAEGK